MGRTATGTRLYAITFARKWGAVILPCLVLTTPAHAQVADKAINTSFGLTAGAIALTDSLSEQGVSGLVQLQFHNWMTFQLNPAVVRLADRRSGASVSGIGDLAAGLSAWHALPGTYSPGIGASLGVSLPTGDSARGLGSGETSFGASLGGSISPTDALSFDIGAGIPLTGAGWSSGLAAARAVSLSFEASYDVSPRVPVTAAFLTAGGGTTAVRNLAVGVTFPLTGNLAVAVDGSHGLTTASPKWAFSAGIGTAFAGLSPVGSGSTLGRLNGAFAKGVNKGSNQKVSRGKR